jgi:hypothetical protein
MINVQYDYITVTNSRKSMHEFYHLWFVEVIISYIDSPFAAVSFSSWSFLWQLPWRVKYRWRPSIDSIVRDIERIVEDQTKFWYWVVLFPCLLLRTIRDIKVHSVKIGHIARSCCLRCLFDRDELIIILLLLIPWWLVLRAELSCLISVRIVYLTWSMFW